MLSTYFVIRSLIVLSFANNSKIRQNILFFCGYELLFLQAKRNCEDLGLHKKSKNVWFRLWKSVYFCVLFHKKTNSDLLLWLRCMPSSLQALKPTKMLSLDCLVPQLGFSAPEFCYFCAKWSTTRRVVFPFRLLTMQLLHEQKLKTRGSFLIRIRTIRIPGLFKVRWKITGRFLMC